MRVFISVGHCRICDEQVDKLPYHIRTHNMNSNEYYDKFIKKDTMEGKCFLCCSDTQFKSMEDGYKKYCSSKCARNCPTAEKKRVSTRKKNYADNPEITKNQVEKFKRTIKNNPEIIKKRIESFKVTLKDKPEILDVIRTKVSLWAKQNPIKAKQKSLKGAETIRRDSAKLENKRKNISIALRDTHNKLREVNSNVPYYIYIIKNLTKPIIKIGITKHPDKRLNEIIKIFGDSKIVFILDSVYERASNIETYLHIYFKEYCKVQPIGGGRTEWFDECILEDTLNILNKEVL